MLPTLNGMFFLTRNLRTGFCCFGDTRKSIDVSLWNIKSLSWSDVPDQKSTTEKDKKVLDLVVQEFCQTELHIHINLEAY